MKDREEGRNPISRRHAEDEFLEMDAEESSMSTQSLESLRNGYSWIHVLEMRYPGWHLHPVEGFSFCLPLKELSESKVAMVSLAGVYRKGQKPFNTSPGIIPAHLRAMSFKDRGDWSFREVPLEADSAELLIAHAHYDHEEADEDINCVFPVMRLVELEVEGFIGECANIHYSLMGYVPEVPLILDTVTGEIVPRLKERHVEAVLVSGGCELSHQSAALIQREIEAAGIPTVSVSVCPDITDRLQVPRAVALRFPFGSPFGASMDTAMQLRVLRDALSLIDTIKTPGEVVSLPYEWANI
jgi:D-proline reductase (dithiol) PrdB